ncbi:hypothetical protein SEA_MILANI_14 [Microbacterium phage Milani]|nr:hypothetical protein SEA_MILANI_14 [Microbacterium phage Milani]
MAELIDEEFADWMEEISVRTFEGETAWETAYSDPTAVPAHWRFENREARASDGSVIVSSTQLQVGGRWRPQFKEGSLVTLPDDPYEYRVVSVRTWPGADTHLEVALA